MIYEKIVQNNSFFNPMIYSKKKKKKIAFNFCIIKIKNGK